MGALAVALAAGEILLAAAAAHRAPAVVDVGPSTGAIGDGFTESEERPPTTFRWSRRTATLEVPVVARSGGPAVVTLRAARFLETPASVHVFVSGRPAGSFTALPGGFHVQRLSAEVPEGPLRIEIVSASPDAEDLGVALDWVSVAGPAWQAGGWAPRAIVAAGVIAALAGGLGAAAAAGVGLGTAVLVALAAAVDPFAVAHASRFVAPGALLLPAAAAFVLRRHPGRGAVAVALFAAYVIKGGAVFHPRYFYPDVRNFGRYVEALGQTEGTLAERSVAAQVRTNTAYPRFVAGRAYAFPYSPLFFLPFTRLVPDRARVEEGLKHAALLAAALEVAAVFLLARAVGAGSGTAAAVLAVFLPPLMSRLLFAMFATLAGHLLDVGAIVSAARAAGAPTRQRWWATFAWTLAALLTYVSSLFNLTFFFAAFAALERRHARALLAIVAGAAVLTVLVLYLPFTLLFVREIVPALLARGGGAGAPATGGGAWDALSRIPLFYGYAYPLLTAAGIALITRSAPPEGRRAVLAYAAACLVLLGLRAFGAGLFKDLKEVEFAGPLVAVATGACVEEIARRGRAGRWAAGMVMAGLIAFGLGRFREYLEAHTALLGLG